MENVGMKLFKEKLFESISKEICPIGLRVKNNK